MNIKTEPRSDLYYGRWEYGMGFRLENLWMTRKMDHGHLDQHIRRYRGTIGSTFAPNMDIKNSDALHAWIDFMRPTSEKWRYKTITSYHNGYIYSNDLDLIQQICDLPYIEDVQVRRAQVTLPPDTIVLAQSPHRLRTYMQAQRVTPQQKQQLAQYLNSQPWRIGPGFRKILHPEHLWHYIREYYFVDHDDERDLAFLNMIVPGIVGKTLPIMVKG
jgi:hypothetical protein